MKKLVIGMVLLGMSGMAQAFSLGGLEWTAVESGNGSVTPSANDALVIGSNTNTGVDGVDTYITTTLDADGMLSFDWDYSTADGGAQYDPFQVIIDDVVVFEFHEGCTEFGCTGPLEGSDSWSDELMAGSVIMLGIFSSDDLFGAAQVTISNMLFGVADQGTGGGGDMSAVPVPPALLLFGSAMGLLGFVRRRKAQS